MKAPRRPLQVGDRVRVYTTVHQFGADLSHVDGEVIGIHPTAGSIRVRYSNAEFSAHPKQCRRLLPKPRPSAPKEEERVAIEQQVGFSRKLGWLFVRPGEEENYSNVKTLRLVELKPGEIPVSRKDLERAWAKAKDAEFSVSNPTDGFSEFCAALGMAEKEGGK